MSQPRQCNQCGAAVSRDAWRHEICPACLLKDGLTAEHDLDAWEKTTELTSVTAQHDHLESSSELAADLQRYLDEYPVEAGPPSASYRLREFIQRHRLGIGTATLILVLLIVTLLAVRSLTSQR